MSDLSLFRLDGTQAIPLPGTAQPVATRWRLPFAAGSGV
jgi:hypothetical protein